MSANARLTRRRFLEVAGAGTLVAGFPAILTACGNSSSPRPNAGGQTRAQPGTLSIFISKDTAHPQQQQQLMDLVKQKFEQANPGSTFTWDTYASAAEEQTKLETSAAAGEGPDIFEFGSTVVPTAYASGAFERITDPMWSELGGKSAFFQPQLTMSGPSPDKLIGVPWSGNPFAFVYNRELFAAAGIKGPPKTWDDFIGAAREITNG
ncbi:MAG TPA: extracellular solute-binding protein, partial [Candidatus Dormibacteraeota bacterium]